MSLGFLAAAVAKKRRPLRETIITKLNNFPIFATTLQFKLYQNNVIQKVLSVMMLAIFTLSITPQTFLHDLFAGHIDTPAKMEPGKDARLGKAGVDCHFNDQVATSPFLDHIEEIYLSAPSPLALAITPALVDAVLSRASYWEGRGPPTIG